MSKLKKLFSLIPIHELEQSAQQQIYNVLELDFMLKLAIMPDCHTGYTLPIGGVALLDDVISPEYVGYDEGCGMCCIITDIDISELGGWDAKVKIFNKIYDTVPLGVGQGHSSYQDYDEFHSASGDKELNKMVNDKLNLQIGTLGSGNHFIEIGYNNDNKVVVVIHSGSRNIGHSIATYYMNLSKNVDIDLPQGYLHLNGSYGQQFLHDQNFALEYALENRKRMMYDVLRILKFSEKEISEYMRTMINENHNHAVMTKEGVLHRKGATPAEYGVFGVIPGTMKSGTYITKGLGNATYLSSASHGAGRKMSRTKAKKSIKLHQHKEWMKGIVAKVDHGTLDEAHGAYKNLRNVIKAQDGIVVDVVDYVKPLINVKG